MKNNIQSETIHLNKANVFKNVCCTSSLTCRLENCYAFPFSLKLFVWGFLKPKNIIVWFGVLIKVHINSDPILGPRFKLKKTKKKKQKQKQNKKTHTHKKKTMMA